MSKQIIIAIFLICSLSFKTFAQEIVGEKVERLAPQEEIKAVLPLIEIKQMIPGEEPLYSFELRDAEIKDLLRILAQDYNLNILIDEDLKGRVTASLRNISLQEALERIADMHNLILEKKGNVIIARPNLITKVFILKNLEAKELLQPPEKKGGEREGEVGFRPSTIYDLLSEEGKILLGKQQNSLVVIDYPANVEKVEEFLRVADQKMTSQIFKLKHLSVKELFPELVEREIEERKKLREERREERAEIKEIKEQEGRGGE